jgi:hypothetical protein
VEPERDRSAYYTDDAKLIYAGLVGAGMPIGVLVYLKRCPEPLARKSLVSLPPPRQHVSVRRSFFLG